MKGRFRNSTYVPYLCTWTAFFKTRMAGLQQLINPTLAHNYHRKPIVYLGLTLGRVHCLGLHKCTMACIHDYNINMELFHCPKIFLGFAYLSLPLSKLSATTSVAGSIASAFSTTSRLLMTKNQKYNY